MINEAEVRKAYAFLREHNSDIADDVLDFIKDAAIQKLDSLKTQRLENFLIPIHNLKESETIPVDYAILKKVDIAAAHQLLNGLNLAPDSKIARIDLTEFRDKGYLQELNRRFLHPLGLALEVIVDDNTDKVICLGGIWDYRDDPEGMAFGDLSSAASKEKFNFIEASMRKAKTFRERLLGFFIQPIGSILRERTEFDYQKECDNVLVDVITGELSKKDAHILLKAIENLAYEIYTDAEPDGDITFCVASTLEDLERFND